jgi:hypothetical protein
MQKDYALAFAAYIKALNTKAIEDKVKAALQTQRMVVANFKAFFHWKVSNEFSSRTKGIKVDGSKVSVLWEDVKEKMIPDHFLPIISEESTIPKADEKLTMAGCKRCQQIISAIGAIDSQTLCDMVQELLQIYMKRNFAKV